MTIENLRDYLAPGSGVLACGDDVRPKLETNPVEAIVIEAGSPRQK